MGTAAAAEKLTEFEEWWAKQQEKQAKLPLHEAPMYKKEAVMEKVNKITNEFATLKKIKKPKEAKKPKNTTKSDSGKKSKAESLPATVADTEKELAAVREKKSAAVEKEDFDAAHDLK